jgi:hypothetical protein
MTTEKALSIRRELLLVDLHAQRQLLAVRSDPVLAGRSFHARSATMRFILRRPHLCLWAIGELLPFVLGKFGGGTGERFARAMHADQDLPAVK